MAIAAQNPTRGGEKSEKTALQGGVRMLTLTTTWYADGPVKGGVPCPPRIRLVSGWPGYSTAIVPLRRSSGSVTTGAWSDSRPGSCAACPGVRWTRRTWRSAPLPVSVGVCRKAVSPSLGDRNNLWALLVTITARRRAADPARGATETRRQRRPRRGGPERPGRLRLRSAWSRTRHRHRADPTVRGGGGRRVSAFARRPAGGRSTVGGPVENGKLHQRGDRGLARLCSASVKRKLRVIRNLWDPVESASEPRLAAGHSFGAGQRLTTPLQGGVRHQVAGSDRL